MSPLLPQHLADLVGRGDPRRRRAAERLGHMIARRAPRRIPSSPHVELVRPHGPRLDDLVDIIGRLGPVERRLLARVLCS